MDLESHGQTTKRIVSQTRLHFNFSGPDTGRHSGTINHEIQAVSQRNLIYSSVVPVSFASGAAAIGKWRSFPNTAAAALCTSWKTSSLL